MKLSHILKNITNVKITDCEIKNITLDSRKANQGTLFCAIKGHNIDARKFIPQTIENNVTAILADSDTTDYIELIDNTQVIYITNLNSKLSAIAGNFYSHPSKKTNLIGITGTNGKTTISQIISQWITILNHKAATMGTIGNGIYGNLTETANTTGSALDIQENLAEFNSLGANYTTMEVSSHGLVQNRVDDLDFDITVFTNLTQDHLDYHNTMEEYFDAKALLFTKFNSKYKIINSTDPYGQKLINKIEDKDSIICITKKDECTNCAGNYVCLNTVEYNNQGTIISFNSSFGNGTLQTKLIGPFNVSNLLQALAAMFALGFNKEDICHAANQLEPVVGRMEVFSKSNKPTIIIDYAHTHDALEKALEAARIHTLGELWCVFGCGGDRDTAKRPLMAQAAEQFADNVIITNDNPRTEDEDTILNDVLAGIKNKDNVKVIKDRYEAIEYSIKNARKTDIILVAGKGHEDYQIFGTEKVHYSDRESACKVLKISYKKGM